MKTISNKILKDRACEITINPKYHRCIRGLISMVYKLFDMKAGSGTKENWNKALAQEFHKVVIKELKGMKVYVRLKYNV